MSDLHEKSVFAGLAAIFIFILIFSFFGLNGQEIGGWATAVLGSTAIATWALALSATFAFVAAALTYFNEVQAQLSEKPCLNDTDHRVDRTVYVRSDLTISVDRPVGVGPDEVGNRFTRVQSEFANLGRSPLMRITATLRVSGPHHKIAAEPKSVDQAIFVGDLAAHAREPCHVRIFVESTSEPTVQVEWLPQALARGKPVRLHASGPHDVPMILPKSGQVQAAASQPLPSAGLAPQEGGASG